MSAFAGFKEQLWKASLNGRPCFALRCTSSGIASLGVVISKVKAHREEIHQRVAAFLSPDQLKKWDDEVAKAKEFLGHRMEA